MHATSRQFIKFGLVGGSGTIVNLAVAALSKKIAGTEKENEFIVTLEVSTTQEIEELQSDTPDAAVMLIIDQRSMDIKLNNDIYPYVADKYDFNKASTVEHNIRNAVADLSV